MPLILPVLIPFATAAAALLGWQRPAFQRWLGVAGALGLFAAGAVLLADVRRDGIRTAQMGGWPAPYGITLVADHFSALMVMLTGAVGAAVAIYSVVGIDRTRQSFAYYPLIHVLLMGVSAAFLAGDLFNLYVWFEVMLIAAFVLLSLGNERPQIEGAVKYVALNLISSFLFLTAVGLLYGAAGTLNMADAARRLDAIGDTGLVATLSVLFFVAFGIKAAVFPLFFWLPASYHTPPAAVSALFGGLMTKVGVYALIRVFTLLFPSEVPLMRPLVLAVAALTMLVGVLGAISERDLRRLLSFQVISGVGYMILGLGLATPLGLAGAVFYMAHSVVVTAALFLAAGAVHDVRGTSDLARLGGLRHDAPWLSAGFGVAALSLAGIPPLSGFGAKLVLIQAGFAAGEYAAVAVAIVTGLLTLYAMAKAWEAAFWGGPAAGGKEVGSEGHHRRPSLFTPGERAAYGLPVGALVLAAAAMGLLAGPVFEVAGAAADDLLDRGGYVEPVLGDGR